MSVEEVVIQTFLVGDPGVIQEVGLRGDRAASVNWRPVLGAAVLCDRMFAEWRVRLSAGGDVFGDRLVQAVGQQAAGSTCPQQLRQTATGYAGYRLQESHLQLEHAAMTEPELNSWVYQDLPSSNVERLVLVSPKMGNDKLLYGYQFLQGGGKQVVIITEDVPTKDLKEASSHMLQNVLWVLAEPHVTRLAHEVTGHPAAIGTAHSLERAEFGAKTLAGYGFRCIVQAGPHGAACAGDGGHVFPTPVAQACASLAAPWRPYEDFYRTALHAVLAGADFAAAAPQLASAYVTATHFLAIQKQEWMLSLTRSLL